MPHPRTQPVVHDEIPVGSLAWNIDPIEIALDQAAAKRGLPPANHEDFAACTEVGRRLLMAQFAFSSWVLRRVEKVRFASDRRIGRSSTIEFQVPAHAPVLLADGKPHWLVPLTVMRRRTLVNLDLRDEEGIAISLLGLRFTQALDESMLRAAARLSCPQAKSHAAMDDFIHRAISERWPEVKAARTEYTNWRDARQAARKRTGESDPHVDHKFHVYFRDPMFRAALERMWHNFTLYVALPVSAGSHRMLRLGFEERVEWRYQLPRLEEVDGTFEYNPIHLKFNLAKSFYQFLGWLPTRIRFLTPSAENCASYHFEFIAPTGLWVKSAAFVAGRPNLSAPDASPWDSVSGTGHSAGLHAVEVPNGSLCRAQVDLRVPSRGWLSTMAVSCWVVALVLLGAARHTHLIGTPGQWTTEQVTNIVLLLVTVCGGVSTYVAQNAAGDVAARMLSGLRILGMAALSLPAVAALSLVYLKDKPTSSTWSVSLLWVLTVVAGLVAGMVSAAWGFSKYDEHHSGPDSPWDMTNVADQDKRGVEETERLLKMRRKSFHELLENLQLDQRAVGVNSAEGWHERYGWNDTKQVGALRKLGWFEDPGIDSTGCTCEKVWIQAPAHVDGAGSPRASTTAALAQGPSLQTSSD